jgi:photosystem II stability/assembly factor-like uncharacterized protein
MSTASRTSPEGRRTKPRRRPRPLQIAIPALAALIAILFVANQGRGGSGARSIARLDSDDVHALLFSPLDPSTVFFGHHDGLLVSADQGSSWQAGSLTGADAMSLAASPQNPQRLYAAGHEVFLRSDDGGQTWTPVTGPLEGADIHAFAASPEDANLIYAYVANVGLQMSRDGGTTWQPLAGDAGQVTALVAGSGGELYAGTANEGVFESADGGRTWQRGGLSGFGTQITALGIAPGSGEVYAGAMMGNMPMLHRRAASGAWETVPFSGTSPILAIALSPHEDGLLLLADQGGRVYRSRDGGESWN